MLWEGRGVKKDKDKSKLYLGQAAAGGLDEYKKYMDRKGIK
jgi:TPR repeat protein